MVDFAELKVRLCEALGHVNGVSIDPNGFYYSECAKEYRDSLEDSDVADVLAGRVRLRAEDGTEKIEYTEPYDAFQRLLVGMYWEEMAEIESAVLEAVRGNADVARFVEEHGVSDEELRECLYDVWFVQPPYDAYLRQDVCVDIMLDTGDANYEFTCNNLASSDIDSVEDFDDNSSLLWLCEQQGVTKDELIRAFDTGSAHTDEVWTLRQRQKEIAAELQGFGFAVPRFAERVIHTGAYQEYARLQAQLVRLTKEIQTLQEKRAQNSLSYQDYLKRHFDRFERLDPMSEEQFKAKQAEILGHFDGKIEAAVAEYARVKDKLDFGTDYRRIAMLVEEHRSIQWKLSDLEKTEAYQKAEFVDSVVKEVRGLASYSGVVTFLVKMPLEKALQLGEVINGEKSLNNSYDYADRNGQSSIVLWKGVRCGLLNITDGDGSVFGIKLLKDVEIPVKAIYQAVSDKELGEYGFMSVYGAGDEFYMESLKEIREVRPEKVEDLIANAEGLCEGLNINSSAKNIADVDRGILA